MQNDHTPSTFLILQLHDERTVIGKTLFKKETKIQAFLGLKVHLSTGIYSLNTDTCRPSVLCNRGNEVYISM